MSNCAGLITLSMCEGFDSDWLDPVEMSLYHTTQMSLMESHIKASTSITTSRQTTPRRARNTITRQLLAFLVHCVLSEYISATLGINCHNLSDARNRANRPILALHDSKSWLAFEAQ